MSCRRGSARAFVVEVSTIALILASGAEQGLAESVQIEQVTVEGTRPKRPPRRQSSTSAPKRAATPRVAAPAPAAPAPSETAWGPVTGYVATRSASGTKTDTPLIETPQSISVITRDQMQAQGVGSLAEALRYTPGVTGELFGLDTRGYGVQLRGFNVWDQAFYKDGLQLRGAGQTAFWPLDPYGAERIEVLRGPASVLYGQNDPGGIVNYVSKRPTDKPFREIWGGVGNFNQFEGKFDLSGPANTDKTLLYRLTGVVLGGDTQVDYVGQNRVFIAPAFTWRPNIDTTLTVLTNFQRDKTGWSLQFLPALGTFAPNPNGKIPTSRFVGEPGFDKYNLTQYSIGYLFEHRVDETWIVRQNARYAHLDNEREAVFGNGLQADLRSLDRYGDYGNSKLDGFAIDNQAQAKFGTGPLSHTLLLGLDHQRNQFSDLAGGTNFVPAIDVFNPSYGQPVMPGAHYLDVGVIQNQTGLYAQDQIKLGKFALALGGRHDWVATDNDNRLAGTNSRQKDSAFTGRVGLVYLSDIGLAPYVSYSESFVPVIGTDASGDPFVPETAQQYEIGVKYQPLGWNAFVTVAAFDLTRQNVRTADPNNPIFVVQTGEVRSRGIEVEAVASLASGLDLRAAYTFLDVEILASLDGNVGHTPYGVPTHRLALWADYTIKSGSLTGFGFGAGLRHIGATWGDDANTFTVPAVTLADAAVHYDWRNFRVALNAQNLFDKEYVASCSGFSYCQYGLRRKVLATLRYRW